MTPIELTPQQIKQFEELAAERDAIEITTFYDDADCDGYCLMEDIKAVIDDE